MVMLNAFLAEDDSIDFPDERATCRDEKATGKVFRRFDAQPEREIPSHSDLSHQVICTGSLITRDDSFRD